MAQVNMCEYFAHFCTELDEIYVVFLNRRAAARYRALASIIQGRETLPF
jgi:hypothetical protein